MRKVKSLFTIVLFIIVILYEISYVYSYRWPFADSIGPNRVTATLGEYRNDTVSKLHNGIDMLPSDAISGTPIYAIDSCDSCVVKDVGSDLERITCGRFSYIHVRTKISNSTRVDAGMKIAELKTLINYPIHLHLTENSGDNNPLRRNGGFDSFVDTANPTIKNIKILRNGSGAEYPSENGLPIIDGQVSIRSNAKDSMSYGSATVSLYRIGFKIVNSSNVTIIPETYKITFDSITGFNGNYIYDTTLSTDSNYEYWVMNRPSANEWWDTTTVSNGTYTIWIIAEDIMARRATLSQTVIVRNGVANDTIAPTISTFSVDPTSTTLNQPFTINYTVTDSGGSGLNRVVLRRTSGDGTSNDPGWQDVGTNSHSGSGDGPISDSFSNTPPSNGTYWYGMAVFDNAGNSINERQAGKGPLQRTVTTASSYSINLGAGWNIMSLPLTPPNNSIEAVLSGISGKYESVWAFDPPGTFRSYKPGNLPASNLFNMEPGRGYYIKMLSSGTVTISGSSPSKIITLANGLNIVGYSTLTSRPVSEAVASLGSTLLLVVALDASTGKFKFYIPSNPTASESFLLEPGKGYWFGTNQSATWIIP